MREIAGTVSADVSDVSSKHASADTIAALADGNRARVSEADIAHVAMCATCLEELALVAGAINDPEVRAAMPAGIATSNPRRTWRMPLYVSGGIAAAAVAAIVLARPFDLRRQTVTTRDSENSAELRIVARGGDTFVGDSLRWTAVPGAENYQVRVWNTDGSVVFSAETRGSAIAVPSTLSPGVEYLLEVKGQIDWDRWAESDLVPIKIRNR